MRLLCAAQQKGRHVCHTRHDAVRVAESECRAEAASGTLAGVVACDRCAGRFMTVVCKLGPTLKLKGKSPVVEDCAARSIDVLRAAPYDEWARVYAALVRRNPPTAELSAAGLRELRPTTTPTIRRGLWFWRWLYGAPCMSPAQMVEYHVASIAQWDPATLAPRDTRCAYATRVRAAVTSLARTLAAHLASLGRAYDAKLIGSAILHADFRVLLLPAGASLLGALYPLHALERGAKATVEDYADNRRVLAVQKLGVGKLRALLAHELAHSFFPAVWMPENHPPAFTAFERELAPFTQKLAL